MSQRAPISPAARFLAMGILGLALGLAGCGASTGVLITLESRYTVPDEIDNLSIEVSGGGKPAQTYQVPLTGPFPHTLAIATEDIAGTLQVSIEATRGSEHVTNTQIRAELVPDRILEYFVTL